MITLNLNNVEELIFYDSGVQRKLPEFKDVFNQWKLSKTSPALHALCRKSLLDFINGLEKEHLRILESYFNTKITLDKLDYHIVKYCDFSISTAEIEINNMEIYNNFNVCRDKDRIYLCFWR